MDRPEEADLSFGHRFCYVHNASVILRLFTMTVKYESSSNMRVHAMISRRKLLTTQGCNWFAANFRKSICELTYSLAMIMK